MALKDTVYRVDGASRSAADDTTGELEKKRMTCREWWDVRHKKERNSKRWKYKRGDCARTTMLARARLVKAGT